MSRDLMMRSLLKVVDNRRDQSTKHFIEPRKLAIIDKLTHAPQMPLMLRDYPSVRTPAKQRHSSRRRPASYIHSRLQTGPSDGGSRRSHSTHGGWWRGHSFNTLGWDADTPPSKASCSG